MRSLIVGLACVTALLTFDAVGQDTADDEWSAAQHVIVELVVLPELEVFRLRTIGFVNTTVVTESVNPAGCELASTFFDIQLGAEPDRNTQLLTDAAYLAYTMNFTVLLLISGSDCSTVGTSAAAGVRVVTGIHLL